MRRVVVTGMGIVSPIGNNADEVVQSLRAGRSGIVAEPVYAQNGFRSQVAGIAPLIAVQDHAGPPDLPSASSNSARSTATSSQAERRSASVSGWTGRVPVFTARAS